ncbi:unnamed protein product [Rotaria sordida]|uniref:Uncharacterized protein n=1 Tax=Rotaria sordida TaxID=392033 RepID=A0A814M5R7_9BILA|nr:unnamed protein product [Rotaria sordida]CAF1261227.1 unnamed protein product [Rotaria sordida]
MSKINGGIRTKNAREMYVEQLPHGQGFTSYMNRKRKPFTHINSFDDIDLAYRSTPGYLREVFQQNSLSSNEMFSARDIPRTKTASELALKSNTNRSTSGNPKYKAQEDYYDEIQLLKKEMKAVKNENSVLRAKIRRLEEDNTRKRKEIDVFYDTSKDGDLRGALSGSLTDRTNNNSNANAILRLKQRIFKLELQLKQKETTIDDMKSDPRWTKGTELEIQNRALFGELERQKVERLNIQQNDYVATVDEEKKNAVRKLNKEKDEYKKENEILKRKLEEFEKLERGKPSSARSSDDSSNKELLRTIEDLKEKRKNHENELKQINDNLEKNRRERDEYRKKFDQAKEELEDMKRERDKQTKLNQPGRSSPALKRDEEQQHRDSISSSTLRIKRPQSPIVENRSPRSSPDLIRRDSNASDEPTKYDSKPSTPIRKPSEPMGSHRLSTSASKTSLNAKRPVTPIKSSAKNVHDKDSTIANDNRVKNFREKRAATVIQREWRRHDKSRKDTLRDANKAKHENLDKWNPKISTSPKSSEIQSPRSNVKVDNLESDFFKRRRSSTSATSNETALKTVQATLRGYLNRSEIDKTRTNTSSPTPKSQSPAPIEKSVRSESEDDDNLNIKPARSLYESEKKRDTSDDQSKLSRKQSLSNDKIQSDRQSSLSTRDSASKIHQSPSPPPVSRRPSSPLVGGSKHTVPNDQYKLGSSTRFPTNDRDSSSKLQRPFSPSNPRRPSSTSINDRRPSHNIPSDNDRRPSHQMSSDNTRRPSHHMSPDDTRRPSRTSPVPSKQSIKETTNENDDDDDDVVGS